MRVPLTYLLLAVFSLGAPLVSQAAKVKHEMTIYQDDLGQPLGRPESVGCSGEANVAIADPANKRLLLYTLQNDLLVFQTNIAAAALPQPLKAAIASDGNVYVLDGKRRRIGLVRPNGEFIRYIDPTGLVDVSETVIRTFEVDADDKLYLLDIFGKRVLVTDGEGKIMRQVAFPPEHGFISDIALNGRGDIFAVDTILSSVYVAEKGSNAFTSFGGRIEGVSFLVSLAVDSQNQVYLLDKHSPGAIVLSPGGDPLGRLFKPGQDEGFLWFPNDICMSGDQFVVSDYGNLRVQVFNLIH